MDSENQNDKPNKKEQYVCECGARMPHNAGAISTHLKGKKHQTALSKKKQQGAMNKYLSNVKVVKPSKRQQSKQKSTLQTKSSTKVSRSQKEVHPVIPPLPVLPSIRCKGVIPSEIIEPEASLMSQIPINRINGITNRLFWYSDTGFHHRNCKGVITDPVSNKKQYNKSCAKFVNDVKLNQIIKTGYLHSNTARNCDMNFNAVQQKLTEMNSKMCRLRTKLQRKDAIIHNNLIRINIQQRILTAIATGNSGCVKRIAQAYQKNGKSPQWLINQFQLFVNGQYAPAGYNDDDTYRSALCLLFGGTKFLEIMYRSGICMSKRSTVTRMNELSENSRGIITRVDDLNTEKITERLQVILSTCSGSQPMLAHYSADEVYVSKKLESEFDKQTESNRVYGLCSEHWNSLDHIDFVKNQRDADAVISSIMNQSIHLTQLVNVIQVKIHFQQKANNKTAVLAALPHCGRSNLVYQKRWIKNLADIDVPGLFDLTLSTDGATQVKSAKKALLRESSMVIEISAEMKFLPTKVIAGSNGRPLFTTSDQRHNIKSSFGKIFGKTVKIVGIKVSFAFIKRLGLEYKVWEHTDKISSEHEWKYLTERSYKQDPMNVPNALKFFDIAQTLTTTLYTEICSKLNQTDLKKFQALKIYSIVKTMYISTLFDRESNWNEILFRFCVFAFSNWILFNAEGTKYETGPNFYECQSTAKGIMLLVVYLKKQSNYPDLLKTEIFLHHIQSQSNENLFAKLRSLAHGPMTTKQCLQLIDKTELVNLILSKRPNWESKSKKLDGFERLNDATALGDRTLRDVNVEEAYKRGIVETRKIFRELAPDYFEQKQSLFTFDNDYHWLKTEKKNYECDEMDSKESKEEEEEEDVDLPQDDSVTEAKSEDASFQQIGMEIRAMIGLPDVEASDFVSKGNKKAFINTPAGEVHLQQYFNEHVNWPLLNNTVEQLSNDRLRAVKKKKKYETKTKQNSKNKKKKTNTDLQDLETTNVFAGCDLLLYALNITGKINYFIGFAVNFTVFCKDSDKQFKQKVISTTTLDQMNVFMDIIPVRCTPCKKKHKLLLNKEYIQKALKATKQNQVDYIHKTVPVQASLRLQTEATTSEATVDIGHLIQAKQTMKASVESFKDFSSKALIDININHIFQKCNPQQSSMTVKQPNKKIINSKSKRKNNKLSKLCETRPLKLNISANTTAKCVFCFKVISSKDLLSHHSLHFFDDFSTTQLKIPTPKAKYIVKDERLLFKQICQAQRVCIKQDTCCFCMSATCKHTEIQGSKKGSKIPDSDCIFFYKYNLKAMENSSKNSPTTNIPKQCPVCHLYVFKYLMQKHYTEFHETVGMPEEFKIKPEEIIAIQKNLKKQHKIGDKIRAQYQGLISQDDSKSNDQQKATATKQRKASDKFSLKKKRSFGAMFDHNQGQQTDNSEDEDCDNDLELDPNHNNKRRKIK